MNKVEMRKRLEISNENYRIYEELHESGQDVALAGSSDRYCAHALAR